MRQFLLILLLGVLSVIINATTNHLDPAQRQVESIHAHPQIMRTRYDIEINLPLAGPGETSIPTCIRPPQFLP